MMYIPQIFLLQAIRLTYNLYHPNEVTFTSPINQATPDAYKVDLTTTDSVYYDSTKYDTALENGDHTYGRLEVSKGEEKIWYLKTIGGAGADVTYSLVLILESSILHLPQPVMEMISKSFLITI